jgi:hypothetical protein
LRRFIRVIFFFLIILFLFNYKKIFSIFSLPQTYKIENHYERVFIKRDGVILFNEDIIYSPYEGKVKYFYRDGDKVKKNSLVALITSNEGEFKFYSNSVGIISLKFDELDFKNEISFDLKSLKEKFNKFKILHDGDMIKIGDPIFKIIDNLYSFVIFENDETLKNFLNSDIVYLKNIENGEIFKGEIVEKGEFIKVKFNKFIEYYLDERIYPFEILIYEGDLIKIKDSFIKNNGFDIKEDFKTRFISIEKFKFIKSGDYFIFPKIDENKPLFDLLGKEIIK